MDLINYDYFNQFIWLVLIILTSIFFPLPSACNMVKDATNHIPNNIIG